MNEMQAERWQKVESLFQSALACSPDARAAHLEQACEGDEKLRREVESLLSFHEKTEGVIDSPAFAEGLQVFLDGSSAAMAGFHIGPYKIIREIGRGGMGAVYTAERADDQYRKCVAVKLIKRGMDADFVIRRFRNERQILANLEHPNIARLIDGGAAADGRPYLVMEYVEGLPITDYCQAHQLSINERLGLFRTVCAAVQFAHQNLVVHRDIKPGNILVTEDGAPKLLDFGIAKLLDPAVSESAYQTATIMRVMTPEYASPEQVRGLPITTATDIYSLGVLLYELLTGRRPYRLETRAPDEITKAICEQEPEKPSQAVSGQWSVVRRRKQHHRQRTTDNGQRTNPKLLRGDLDNIVLMALRKEPQRRYVSVAQFAEDIGRHLDGLPIIAHKDTLSYRAGKFVMRHKGGVAAAAMLAIALIAGAIGIIWQARVARRQAKIATQERDRARIETAKAARINQFLQDTLGFADPAWYSPNTKKGLDATVGDALAEASQRAESELTDQPEVLAGVLRTTGASYKSLGRLDLAEHDLRKSLDLYRQVRGDIDPETANSLTLLAETLTLKGDYASAEELFKEASAIYEKTPEGNVPTYWIVTNLSDLGLLKSFRGDPEAGESFLNTAVKLIPKLTGNERALAADVLSNLGQLRQGQGRLDEAESLYRNSIEENRKLPGRPRLELANSLIFLGDLLKTKGKYDEAETVLLQSLDVLHKIVDEKNPYLGLNFLSLARVRYVKGDYVAAEKDVNKSIENFKQVFPEGHVTFAAPLTTLGLIQNKTGRSRVAEANLRKAVEIDERSLPKGNWQIAIARGALGECLMTEKRYVEAEPLLVESYNVLKASQGEQNPRTDEARQRLTRLYELWRKPDKLAAMTHPGPGLQQ